MTTATDRRTGSRPSAVRCVWTVVVALFAVLAVLVHHDVTSAVMPARAMTPIGGMDHTSAAMTPGVASAGPGRALQAVNTPMDDDGGACSGPAMQHCSAGDVGTTKLVPPPPAAIVVGRPDAFRGVPARRGLPATSHRAPPDLSLLSRLLI